MDFSTKEIDNLLALIRNIEQNFPGYVRVCDGKKLATLLYEPSTRIRLSFEATMLSLGDSALDLLFANSSFAAEGESVADAIRVISCYADICAVRYPKEDAVFVAAQKAQILVTNVGDGGHQRPTQTLTGLVIIRFMKGYLGNLTVGSRGDLKFGRTVHSLISAMVRYPNVKFMLIFPPELCIPGNARDGVLTANNVSPGKVDNLDDALGQLDIPYITRVQKERFFNEEDYIRLKGCYILDKKKMKLAKEDMCVLHLLLRVNEISVEMDDGPRVTYLKQAQYDVYVRMVLIMRLLEVQKPR